MYTLFFGQGVWRWGFEAADADDLGNPNSALLSRGARGHTHLFIP